MDHRPLEAIRRGRLRDPSAAPLRGERVERLAEADGHVVEQILSGCSDGPVEFLQDHDEWVVVLAGGAELEVAGKTLQLGPGDWVLLPAGTPHRLLDNEAGTSWLAVHLPPPITHARATDGLGPGCEGVDRPGASRRPVERGR